MLTYFSVDNRSGSPPRRQHSPEVSTNPMQNRLHQYSHRDTKFVPALIGPPYPTKDPIKAQAPSMVSGGAFPFGAIPVLPP